MAAMAAVATAGGGSAWLDGGGSSGDENTAMMIAAVVAVAAAAAVMAIFAAAAARTAMAVRTVERSLPKDPAHPGTVPMAAIGSMESTPPLEAAVVGESTPPPMVVGVERSPSSKSVPPQTVSSPRIEPGPKQSG